MKKTIFILCCLILFCCNSQKEETKSKKETDKFEEILIQLYPSGNIEDLRYLISIKKNTLLVSNLDTQVESLKEFQLEFDDNQKKIINDFLGNFSYEKLLKSNYAEDGWGMQLKINDTIYYKSEDFSINSAPKEIKELLLFVNNLSRIKIDLYGFS